MTNDNRHRLSLPNYTTKSSLSSVCKFDSSPKSLNMDTLMGSLPFTSSSRLGNVSPTDDRDRDHDLPPDFARASAEFYTPTYQAMKNSTFFSNKQREKSRRLSNASTVYESIVGNELGHQSGIHRSSATVLDGFDPEILGLMPAVPEEMSLLSRKGGNATPSSANCEDFSKATPVSCQLNYRSKPFQEFMDEVQSQKQRAEVDASRKTNYTDLLRKLRIKEDAIDAWESKQKSKAEDQLDKLERRLEKKRSKAVQRTHKKLVETEQEAEKRRGIARRVVLKEMSKLHINS
ncbi:hypothetical protein RND81_02G110900 [Saponaria officinalis]|uniref:Remorin C-terminal domain-containing protein n=1 Tax=Saponaria officinalis TaxID=3572 RepID=A0AAW1MPN8_SAPOF